MTLPAGVTLGDGPPGVGKALHFGKESAVNLPNIPEIDTDKPFTIAAWVRIPKVDESYGLASQVERSGRIQKGGRSTPEPKEWGWTAKVSSNNSEPSVFSISLEGSDGRSISARNPRQTMG